MSEVQDNFVDSILNQIEAKHSNVENQGGQDGGTNDTPGKTEIIPPVIGAEGSEQPPAEEPQQEESGENEAGKETPEEKPKPDEKPKEEKEQPPVQAAAPDPNAEPDLTEEQLLRILSKKTGREITSLDELNEPVVLTPEQQAAAEEQRRNDAIAFGISNKLFSRKELDGLAVDAAKPARDLAYESFKAIVAKNAPNTPVEDYPDMFVAWAHENESEDSPLRLMKQAEMEAYKNNYLNNTYGNLLNVDKAYTEHMQTEQSAREYKSSIDKAFKPFFNDDKPYEMEFAIDDKNKYNFKVDQKSIKEVYDRWANQDMFTALGKQASDSAFVKQTIENAIVAKEFPRILREVAESHASKKVLDAKAGRKGIPPERNAMEDGRSPHTTGPSDLAQSIMSEYA